MIDLQSLTTMATLAAFVAGIGIGLFYFGGLWITVRGLASARQPAQLMIASFVIRNGLGLALLYWVIGGPPVAALACISGFLIARTLLIRRWGPA